MGTGHSPAVIPFAHQGSVTTFNTMYFGGRATRGATRAPALNTDPPPVTEDYSDLRVLVVDDQLHVRQWVSAVLGSLGVEHVAEASNGRSALRAVTEPGAAFDLIICDLRMPDTDGVETIRTMARMGVRSAVAILSVEHERIIESAGILATLGGLDLVGAIEKPLTLEKLAPVLERVQARRALARVEAQELYRTLDLSDALINNEITLLYQPVVRTRDRVCICAESLLQWNHPTYGPLDHSVILQLAARAPSFLVNQLTSFTVREAVAAAERWQASGSDIGVAINISPLEFIALDLPELVESMVLESQVPASQVTIEMPELVFQSDAASVVDSATRLRLKGFRLSLDHFTGSHQSMAKLATLPLSELKLDPTLVDGCADSAHRRDALAEQLAVARDMQLSTVALGVAQHADWSLLGELGCDAAQGPFIAPAMEESGLLHWLTQRRSLSP